MDRLQATEEELEQLRRKGNFLSDLISQNKNIYTKMKNKAKNVNV